MKLAPSSAVQAIMLAKRIASKVDPGFASVDIPTFGHGAPVERASGGYANGGYSEGGEIDTNDEGKTLPESDKTLEHQRQLLLEGRRKAVMYPKGGNPAPEAPDGAGETITPDGTFHFNPALVTEEQIHEASRQHRLNEVLGLGPYSKQDIAKRIMQGEHPVAVVARDHEGHEVVSAAGTHATAAEQIEAMRHQVPEGGAIGIEHPEQVIRDRQAVHRAAGGEVDDGNDLNDAGLYSQAAKAADSLKQAKGRPQDMLRAISTSPGVKADEFKWSGANEAFANQPSVTKEDLVHHFHNRIPQLLEKTYHPHGKYKVASNPANQTGILDGPDWDLPEDFFTDDREELPSNSHGASMYHKYQMAGPRRNYREVLMHLPENDALGGNYQSSHWHEPNVVAHLRMSDRSTPEGQKVLHLEELQSDWGQDARKKGVAGIGPDAPYINKTENWTDLGLKRALIEAAKGGYDKFVWTPGKEQANRYDLSHHIDHIEYEPEEDGTHTVVAHDSNGEELSAHAGKTHSEISDIFGKEIADKIHAGHGDRVHGPYRDWKKLSNLDLKTGGEGMEGYYDKLLPNRLIKLAREHDPEAHLGYHEVGAESRADWVPASLNGSVPLPGLTITPRMRESILKRGFKAYAKGGEVGFSKGGSPDMDRVRAALARVSSPFSADPKSVNSALMIARSLKTPMGGETGTGSFYNVKQPMGVSDVSATVANIPGVTPKDIQHKSWEALHKEGGTLLNLGGDRSALGRLTHINGKELAWPVDLHAGTSYMREPNKGQVWANNPSHATALQKVIRAAAKTGPVFGAFGPMGPRAVDSSHNMFDALMAQIPTLDISKADAKAFDESIMRGEHIKGTDDKSVAKRASAIKYLETWPGIKNAKAASEFARDLPGGHRSDIVKYMDTALWAKKGFPSVGVTRAAISDPDVKGASGNMLGHRIVKFNPDATDTHPKSFEHSTYSTDTPGEYWGDVPLVQRHYAMPDVIDQMLSNPTKSGQIIHPYSPDSLGRSTARKLFEEQKQTQPINDRMLESIQQGLERQKDYGLNKGGTVNKAIGVAMRAQKRR